MNRFQFVAGHHTRYGVKRLCQIIGVARSSYYYWTSTAPERAARDAADSALAGKIRQVHADSDGAPRVTAELRDIGRPVNHTNQRYVGDITYLPVGERGFLYLAILWNAFGPHSTESMFGWNPRRSRRS